MFRYYKGYQLLRNLHSTIQYISLQLYHQLRPTHTGLGLLQRIIDVLQALSDNGRRREALQLSALQRGRHEVPVGGRRDIVDGEDHARLDIRGHIVGGRRVHAGEVATAQLPEDVEIAGVRVGSGDGVEDADECRVARLGGFDDFFDDGGVLVVKDLSGSAALDQIVVVRARDGDDVDSSGRGDLSRHGADGRRSAVDDEGLACRRCRGL